MSEEGVKEMVDVERTLLGAILLDCECYEKAAVLGPECFSLDSHRRIFSCIRDLADSSNPVDLTTVVLELERRGDLDRVGGPSYVGGLIDGVPDAPHVQHYIKIL